MMTPLPPEPLMIVATVLLVAVLVLLSGIDLATRRLPDWLTLPLLAVGLFLAGLAPWPTLMLHLAGAVLGYMSLWAVSRLYHRWRGSDGLGLGDAKLLAAAGAWLGPLALAPVVFIATLLALCTALGLRAAGRDLSWTTALPFGPFLSIGFAIMWGARLAGVSVY